MHDNEPKRKISVVIACYNEQKNITPLYQRLVKTFQSINILYEIIWVDNCSTDDSIEVYNHICGQDQHCQSIIFSRNFGSSQPSFQAGLELATGDAVVLMDGDLQDPPEVITEFYDQWQQGFDIVYGQRVKRHGSLFRRINYWFFYRLFRHVAYIPIPLDAGDFALFDRKVVDKMNQFPERNRYIRGIRAWTGFNITSTPYTRDERHVGKSSNTFFDNIRWAEKAFVNFSFYPLKLIFRFGVLWSFITVLIIAGLLIPTTHHFLFRENFLLLLCLILILLMGLLGMISFYFLAMYIRVIFEEVKQRPTYLIEKVIKS